MDVLKSASDAVKRLKDLNWRALLAEAPSRLSAVAKRLAAVNWRALVAEAPQRLPAGLKAAQMALGPRPLENPRVLLGAVGATLCFLILWSALAEVERIVRVEGRLVPSGKSQQIQHLEGGIVATIDTTEGAVVARGDRLVTIDNTSADANMGESQGRLSAEKLRAARLSAEAEAKETFQLPPDLAQLPAAEVERQLFQTRRLKFEQEQRIYQEQLRQRQAEYNEIGSRKKRLEGELDTAKQRSSMIVKLVDKNAASQMEVLDAKSREQRLSTEIGEAEGTAPKLLAAISELEARLQESRARFRAEAQAELIKSLGEIERLEQVITTQSDRLTRTEVKAPVAGIVNRLAVTTLGGVIKPGETIAEITPFTSTLLIEAKANPKDRGELRAGLLAHIRISAHDAAALGVLGGRVTDVGADTVADAKGDVYYRVTLIVDQLPSSYEGRLMTPGMTVQGDVVIGKRTILNYLLSPLNKFAYNAFRDAR